MAKKVEKITNEDIKEKETIVEENNTETVEKEIKEIETITEVVEEKPSKEYLSLYNLINISSSSNISLSNILLAYRILLKYSDDFNNVHEVINLAKKLNRVPLKEALMYLEIVGK